MEATYIVRDEHEDIADYVRYVARNRFVRRFIKKHGSPISVIELLFSNKEFSFNPGRCTDISQAMKKMSGLISLLSDFPRNWIETDTEEIHRFSKNHDFYSYVSRTFGERILEVDLSFLGKIEEDNFDYLIGNYPLFICIGEHIQEGLGYFMDINAGNIKVANQDSLTSFARITHTTPYVHDLSEGYKGNKSSNAGSGSSISG